MIVFLALCCHVAAAGVAATRDPGVLRVDPIMSAERDTLMELFGSTQPGSSADVCAAVIENTLPSFMVGTGAVPSSGCGGGSWRNSAGWGSTKDLGSWVGVTTDASGRVVKLDLNHNELNGPLPDLSALTALQELDLRGNKLTGTIPQSTGRLTSLTELYLSANSFTGIHNDMLIRINIYLMHCAWQAVFRSRSATY